MNDDDARAGAYRAAIIARIAPQARDLGRVSLDDPLSALDDAGGIADVDAQEPAIDTERLAAWAHERAVTLASVTPWGLALGPPDVNHRLRGTHGRESEMSNVRSYIPLVPALADAFTIVETRIAPVLPLGATRRALLHLTPGTDSQATAAVLADVERRRQALTGSPSHATIEAVIPDVRDIARDLSRTTVDFRANALATKLIHAAVTNRQLPDLGPLMPDANSAHFVTSAFEKLELDRALYAFAYHWADDPSLEPFVTYRGVRLDDLASRMLLRRFGHPAYQDE